MGQRRRREAAAFPSAEDQAAREAAMSSSQVLSLSLPFVISLYLSISLSISLPRSLSSSLSFSFISRLLLLSVRPETKVLRRHPSCEPLRWGRRQ